MKTRQYDISMFFKGKYDAWLEFTDMDSVIAYKEYGIPFVFQGDTLFKSWNDDGDNKTILHCLADMNIDWTDFKKHINDAIRQCDISEEDLYLKKVYVYAQTFTEKGYDIIFEDAN